MKAINVLFQPAWWLTGSVRYALLCTKKLIPLREHGTEQFPLP